MQKGYIIEAYSPSTGQRVRRFDLGDMQLPTDPQLAQRDADAFAGIQNRDGYLHARDWRGEITLMEVGIETLRGFQGFDR
jgi:hypothetical protein